MLGFQVEHNGPKNIVDEKNVAIYDNEAHMLKVLDVILNKSYHKLGFQNGKGMTKEFAMASAYAEFFERFQNGMFRFRMEKPTKEIPFSNSPDEKYMDAEELMKNY